MATKAADNRYANVKWGQTKWGASATRSGIAYGLDIDWNGDGLFDGVNDAQRMTGFKLSRGRRAMFRPNGNGMERVQVGRLEVTLDNYDGRYDAWNTSSPLYPNVGAGKDISLKARDLSGSASAYPIFYGIIADIQPFVNANGERHVRLLAEDAISFLQAATVGIATTDISLSSGGIYGGMTEAMIEVLIAIGWPPQWGHDLAIGALSWNLYTFWAPYQMSAADIMHALSTELFSPCFINRTGQFTFRHSATNYSSTQTLTEAVVDKNITVSQPWLNKRNLVRLVSHPRVAAASGLIWELSGTQPSIADGATAYIVAQYTYSGQPVPAKSVVQPVATTDWLTNTLADGTGTDATGSCTLRITDYGDRAIIAVKNNYGSTVYLTKAQITGVALYAGNLRYGTYPSDPTSVVNPHELIADTIFNQFSDAGALTAQAIYTKLAENLPSIVVRINGRPDIQFARELFDVVTTNFPTLGLTTQKFWIGGIEMESRGDSCQDVLTTYYLEPLFHAV